MIIESDGHFNIVSHITYHDKPHHENYFYCSASIGSVVGYGLNIELRDWDLFFDLVKKTDVVMQQAKQHYAELEIKEENARKDSRL